MTSFLKDDRSSSVALWLFIVAGMVVGMVVLGGATRLTDSGLSITEWRPIAGALPPLNEQAWAAEFAKYRLIPQFTELNPTMTLSEFRFIYWWEWSHRQLGRLVGVVFVVPFIFFLARRMIPRRLIWRCFALLFLGGLQGFVGWWMVYSGLSGRVSVAPERLMIHLSLALFLFCALVWNGLEASEGKGRGRAHGPFARVGLGLVVLIFIQAMLGALVAANDAGRIMTDWPLMGGEVFPDGYWKDDLWTTLVHNAASVQFHHRMFGYLVFILITAFIASAANSRDIQPTVRGGAFMLGGLAIVQVILGVVTLVLIAPLGLSIAHQIIATMLLGVATWFTWRARRL